jgi:hypothetical protein
MKEIEKARKEADVVSSQFQAGDMDSKIFSEGEHRTIYCEIQKEMKRNFQGKEDKRLHNTEGGMPNI